MTVMKICCCWVGVERAFGVGDAMSGYREMLWMGFEKVSLAF